MFEDDDLAARLSAATRHDTVRGVVFNAALDLVCELAGNPAAVECDPEGKGRRREFFSYPVADFLRIAWRAVEILAPRLGEPSGVFREIGARASRRWLASALGQTVVAFAGRDPRRLLSNASVGYRNVVSYGTRTIEWVHERHARLVFRRDFLVPPFHCGALATVLQETCGIPFRAEGREIAFLDSEYDVTW
jgi:uncharacterized protein (TIGR02265 family)